MEDQSVRTESQARNYFMQVTKSNAVAADQQESAPANQLMDRPMLFCRAGHIQHAHEGWAIHAKYAATISVKTEKASVVPAACGPQH